MFDIPRQGYRGSGLPRLSLAGEGLGLADQMTIRFMVRVLCMLPLLAVTVSGYVPVGVWAMVSTLRVVPFPTATVLEENVAFALPAARARWSRR